MMHSNWREHRRKFEESKNNVAERLALVTQFREGIEVVHTAEYANFLEHLFPAFQRALREGPPWFTECDEQKIRHTLLEILNRLPSTEPLRPHVVDLLRLVMHILAIDNEENAIICLRIIFDVHKNFTPDLENEVQPFLNFFINLYKNLQRTVHVSFRDKVEYGLRGILPSGQAPPVKTLPKSSESFKVLTECPLIVMLLFQVATSPEVGLTRVQVYQKYVNQNMLQLIPLMIRALTYESPSDISTPARKQVYADFIAAQVKTLSFLTYALRKFASNMLQHMGTLADCVIKLLMNCPPEAVNSRKELLVATRHILATDFRKAFFSKVAVLLDEKVLIGTVHSERDAVRPLAYSTLADLVHHVRSELTMPLFAKVIHIFSRNIHDPTLPLAIQTSAVRLILNLVDHIYRAPDANKNGRALLVRVMVALVNKFDTLKTKIKRLTELVVAKFGDKTSTAPVWTAAYTPRTEEEFPEDSVREVKQLMYTMVYGLKTVVWCISNFRHPAPAKRFIALDRVECNIVAQFLMSGLHCFAIYSMPVQLPRQPQPRQEEKDVLEHFASVFTVLDKWSFREVFSQNMEVLFGEIVSNQKLPMLIIPQHFLSSSNVSKSFADILLAFLVERMADMAEPTTSSPKAAVMLNLFRIVFGSVTLFPENEAVLRPYLRDIVENAMQFAMKVRHPMNYFALLRALFRSIGGGKFEMLYKEFLPLLQDLLQGHMSMRERGPEEIREIAIELCLTVPARLSSLLPYIPLLMKAVVFALQAQDEPVVKLGLRTLEFWVDYLKPDYLYPHMCEVLPDLMRSLCALLRPKPSPYGSTALNSLGKLGGRNRRFLLCDHTLEWKPSPGEGLQVSLNFRNEPPANVHRASKEKLLPFRLSLESVVELASAIIRQGPPKPPRRVPGLLYPPAPPPTPSLNEDQYSIHARYQAFLLLRSCLLSMMRLGGNVGSAVEAIRTQKLSVDSSSLGSAQTMGAATEEKAVAAMPIGEEKKEAELTNQQKLPRSAAAAALARNYQRPSQPSESQEEVGAVRARTRHKAQEELVKKLFVALIVAAADSTLSEEELKKAGELCDEGPVHVVKATTIETACTVGATKPPEAMGSLSHLRPPAPVEVKPAKPIESEEEKSAKKAVRFATPRAFLRGLTQHIGLMLAGCERRTEMDEIQELNAISFLDALVAVMCEGNRKLSKAAEEVLETLLDTLVAVLCNKTAGAKPVVPELLSRLSHCCYHDKLEHRHAGCVGLSLLCSKLSPDWVTANQAELIRALMFTFRDSESDFAADSSALVTRTLDQIMRMCCGEYLKQEPEPVQVELPDKLAKIPAPTAAAPAAAAPAVVVPPAVRPTPAVPTKDAPRKTEQPLRSPMVQNLVAILAPELISGTRAVRDCAHKLLELVGKLTKMSVSVILTPYRTKLMAPVLQQSLHAVPISIRIGYISAATYCLSLRPPLVTVDNLMYLLQDAITDVSEQDDRSPYVNPAKSGRKLLNIRLRVESINLMSAALASEDVNFEPQKYQELKNRSIRVFFRSLMSRSSKIIEAAKEGLRQVIKREKLPKDLLQQCLRPILVNLADTRKLSVRLLDGLGRLLELLSNCFNVTLGEKLLEHLATFADPEKLSKLRQDAWSSHDHKARMTPEEEVNIASAMLDLFHLLPPAPQKFIDRLVRLTMKLESQLLSMERSYYGGHGMGPSSPYRKPLLKFLASPPARKVTMEFFLRRLPTPLYAEMFRALLKDEDGGPLRAILMELSDQLLSFTFFSNGGQPNPADLAAVSKLEAMKLEGLHIVHILVQNDPTWLARAPKVVKCLHDMWTSRERKSRLMQEDSVPIYQLDESRLVVECLISYLRARSLTPEEVPILWNLLRAFEVRCLTDWAFLIAFFKEVAVKLSVPERRHVMHGFFQFFEDPSYSYMLKVHSLKLIIIPMLQHSFKQGHTHLLHVPTPQAAVPLAQFGNAPPVYVKPDLNAAVALQQADSGMGDAVSAAQWEQHAAQMPAAPVETKVEPNESDANAVLDTGMVNRLIKHVLSEQRHQHYRDELKIELLRLATLLMQNLHEQLRDYRKDLIKFAWSHLKSKNSAKHWAYVDVCRFIDVYETPSKIVIQVYVSLLRAYQSDTASLVRKALDILVPALPRRLPPGEHKYPSWIKWTKKIIVEDGHFLPHLAHIWNLIVRHSDLFYSSRTQFVPQMVNSLNRLGLPANRALEHRLLAVDLAGLILQWDERCAEELKKKQPKEPEFRPIGVMVELVCGFFIRLALMMCENVDTRFISERCLTLLKKAVVLWPHAVIKFAPIDKILTQVHQDEPTLLLWVLHVLNVLVEARGMALVEAEAENITKVMSMCYKRCQKDICAGMCELVTKIVAVAPPSGRLSPSMILFYRSLYDSIESGLKIVDKEAIHTQMQLASIVSHSKPGFLDPAFGLLVKVLQKLTKEHIATQATPPAAVNTSTTEPVPSVAPQPVKQLASSTLVICLELIADRHHRISDHKKLFYQSLLQLLEKSKDTKVLASIVKMVGGWINNSAVTPNMMTPQEKVQFLQKMTRFELMESSSTLHHTFLGIIFNLFSVVSGRGPQTLEWLGKLQKPFLVGLRCNDVVLRSRFTTLFQQFVIPTVFDRMVYIFSQQDWEPLGDGFWIPQMLDLLLPLISLDGEVADINSEGIKLPCFAKCFQRKTSARPADAMEVEVPTSQDETKETLSEREKLVKQICADQEAFVAELSSLEVSHLVRPLRCLVHCNKRFAAELWINLFPAAWAKLNMEERRLLTPAINALLARDWHLQQKLAKPAPLQALMWGFAKCQPLPAIRPQTLQFLARHHNCWFSSIHILEELLAVAEDETRILVEDEHLSMHRSGLSLQETEELAAVEFWNPNKGTQALASVYKLLSENDMYYGLMSRRVRTPHTKAALALEQFGWWARAQEILYRAMSIYHSSPRDSEDFPPQLRHVPTFETLLWEEEWVQCSKHLSQWEVLSDFATGMANPALQLECVWRLSDGWNQLKTLLNSYDIKDTPEGNLYEIYRMIHEQKFADKEIERACDQGVQLALRDWQIMPEFVTNAHLPLLQRFQRLVELQESAQMLQELSNYSRQGQLPNLKNFITTWRERLPNKWECIPVWSDVLTWRQHMFQFIQEIFAQVSERLQLRIHDTPWTVIRFAHVARKQQLHTVCLTSLATLYAFPSMEACDAFHKLREQIKTLLNSPHEIRAALNIISSTNLHYFTVEQKAEMFRLKGECLQNLGYGDESNTAFSGCLSICDSYGKGWLSWGAFCDRVFQLKKDLQWAEHAVVCYLQAVAHKSRRARPMIARVLWLLSYERQEKGSMHLAFARFVDHVPCWEWLLWIPQLLSSLARLEGVAVKSILSKIARKYPQSLYYTLRSYLIEKRESRAFSPGYQQQRQGAVAPSSASAITPVTSAATTVQKSFAPTKSSAPVPSAPVPATSAADTPMKPVPVTTSVPIPTTVTAVRAPTLPPSSVTIAPTSSGTGGFMPSYPATFTPAGQPLTSSAAADPSLGFGSTAASSVATAALQQVTSSSTVSHRSVGAVPAGGTQSATQRFFQHPSAPTPATFAAPSQARPFGASTQITSGSSAAARPADAAAAMRYQKQPSTAPARSAPNTAAAVAASTASTTAASSSSATGSKPPFAIQWVEEVVGVLRRSHPSLMTEVERMLDEFSRRFKPEPEEELLGAVHALVLKCFKQRITHDDKVSMSLVATIDRVCCKFFTPDPSSNNRRHLAFVFKYKRAFEKDFLPPPKGKNFPSTLTELIRRLKTWKYHLQARVGRHAQINLKLERLSPYLIRFQSYDIEIPGQYFKDQEPNKEAHIILQHFDPNVRVHHTHGFSHRRVGMCGSDGHFSYFLVQYSISHITRSDERMTQLYVLLNRMMGKYKETRRRNLVFHIPLVVPLTHRLRLMGTTPALASFEQVYEESCANRCVDSDEPLLLYRERLSKVRHTEMNVAARQQVFEEVCNSVIPDNVLRKYIHGSLKHRDELWAFKRVFTAQLALSGHLSYLMSIGDRTLHKLSFSKESARVINSEFYPGYTPQLTIESSEPVPFRLTRNLVSFVGPVFVEGVFSAVLAAANSCFLRNQEVLKNYMCLFIRDDLLSWNTTKISSSPQAQRTMEENLREKINTNVHNILKRVHVLVPNPQTEKQKQRAPLPITHKLHHLIQTATSKEKQCQMNPTWHPWF